MKKQNENKPYMVIVHYNEKANYKYKGEIRSKKPQIFYFATLESAFKSYCEWKGILKISSYEGYKTVELSMNSMRILALPPLRSAGDNPTVYQVVPANGDKFVIVDGPLTGQLIYKEFILKKY